MSDRANGAKMSNTKHKKNQMQEIYSDKNPGLKGGINKNSG